mgnify:CR=1 FL=1
MMLYKNPNEEQKRKGQTHENDIETNIPTATKRTKGGNQKGNQEQSSQELVQYYYGVFEISLNKTEYEWLLFQQNHLINRTENENSKRQSKEFKAVVDFMSSKNKIFNDMMDATGKAYLAAVYLMDLKDTGTIDTSFVPKKAKNKDTSKIGAYYKYTTTPMDLSKSTFEEAIQNHKYVQHECFINTLYDFYHDSLLSADKKKKNVIVLLVIRSWRSLVKLRKM